VAEFARKIFGSLSNRTVMVIGAGETGKLTLRHLQSLGASSVLVTNRTQDRAVSLAQKIGGEVVPFDQMADQLHRADIVISSTDAPHFVIHPAQVRAAIERRRNEPMFLIDIAVPRDIDPKVNDIDNVYLYDIDDLQRAVEENSAEREGELQRCRAIVEEEVGAFAAHCAEETAHPTIAELRQAAEEIRRAELDKLLALLPQLGPEGAAQIDLATRRIVNKLLHGPQETLTQEARAGRAGPVIRLVRRLFGLRGG
jgi:glutamyl-tRNA reductase